MIPNLLILLMQSVFKDEKTTPFIFMLYLWGHGIGSGTNPIPQRSCRK